MHADTDHPGCDMSDSAPRRLQPRGTVYVDYETGFEVSDAQYRRIEKIVDAVESALRGDARC